MDSLFSGWSSETPRWHDGQRYDSVPATCARGRGGGPGYIAMDVNTKFVSVAAKLSQGIELTEIKRDRIRARKVRREKRRNEKMQDEARTAEFQKAADQLKTATSGGGMAGCLCKSCESAAGKIACRVACFFCVCCTICCCGKLICSTLCGCCGDLCDPIGDLLSSLGDLILSPFKAIGSAISDAVGGAVGSVTDVVNPTKWFGKRLTHPLRNHATVQTHTASVPSHWRFIGVTLPIFATGLLLLMSYQIGDNHPAAVAAEKEFCQQLLMSKAFNTTKMFDSAIESLLPGCYSTKEDVLDNSYQYSCIDMFGRPKYTAAEMRDTIMSGIRWASAWDASTDITNITSTIIQSVSCNSTTGDGYYALDGTHHQIQEVCRYLHIFSQASEVTQASLLHDLHELHIPECKSNHTNVLSRTFSENCSPPEPA